MTDNQANNNETPQVTQLELVSNLQKNLLRIAEELDAVRLNTTRDFNIISMNVGRLQGLAQGLDWYLSQLQKQKNSSIRGDSKTFGFDLNPGTLIIEDEEEEEDNNGFND